MYPPSCFFTVGANTVMIMAPHVFAVWTHTKGIVTPHLFAYRTNTVGVMLPSEFHIASQEGDTHDA
jgi:hypothetical protein